MLGNKHEYQHHQKSIINSVCALAEICWKEAQFSKGIGILKHIFHSELTAEALFGLGVIEQLLG
ncbi:MAG: hypothetical protein AAF490_05745 [Chloroflexota bacterium]